MVKIKLLIVWVLVFICSVAVSAASTRSAAANSDSPKGINASVRVEFKSNMPQIDVNMDLAIPKDTTITTATYGDIFTWRDPAFQNNRRGYTFEGWNTAPDGSGTDVVSTSTVPTTDTVKLYAKWVPMTMTVTFNVNGGYWVTQPNPNPFTVTYGTTYRDNTSWDWTVPKRAGKIFFGWNVEPDGTKQYYGPDALISLLTNHTLYAVWVDSVDASLVSERDVCYEVPVSLCGPSNFTGYTWSPTTGLSNPNSQCPTLNPAAMTSDTVVYTCQYTLGNIYNYNFSLGGVGFSTDYDILEDLPDVTNELQPERKVCVVTCWGNVHNVLDKNCILESYEGDKAEGGTYLAINGGAYPNEVVWEQTVAIAKNTTYHLSARVARAIGSSKIDSTLARLLFFINGVKVSTDTLVMLDTVWTEMTADWNSGDNDFATICLKDFCRVRGGNDFCLDHINFTATTLPTPGTYEVKVCRRKPFTAGSIPTGSEVICTGSSVSTIGEATAPASGVTPYSYQWYVSINGATPTLISGANSATYTPNEYKNTIGTYVFTRKAKDSECAEWTSSEGEWTLEVKQGLDLDVCPPDMNIELWMDTPDTMVTPEMAGIQVFYDAAEAAHIGASHVHISHNLDDLNRMGAGEHTVVWTVTDDCGNVAQTCNQKITVVYPPCVGADYQGHTYDAVRVGYQCWLTENLRNDNKPDGTTPVANKNTYDENPANTGKYGDLYSWYSAVDVPEGDNTAVPNGNYVAENGSKYVQGICPKGWAVPSEHDFDVLNDFAGDVAYLKDMDAQYWIPGKGGKTPNYGFQSRGSGRYNSATAQYEDLLTNAYYWRATSTPGSATIISSEINYYCTYIIPHTANKTDLQSIRCIKKKRFED